MKKAKKLLIMSLMFSLMVGSIATTESTTFAKKKKPKAPTGILITPAYDNGSPTIDIGYITDTSGRYYYKITYKGGAKKAQIQIDGKNRTKGKIKKGKTLYRFANAGSHIVKIRCYKKIKGKVKYSKWVKKSFVIPSNEPEPTATPAPEVMVDPITDIRMVKLSEEERIIDTFDIVAGAKAGDKAYVVDYRITAIGGTNFIEVMLDGVEVASGSTEEVRAGKYGFIDQKEHTIAFRCWTNVFDEASQLNVRKYSPWKERTFIPEFNDPSRIISDTSAASQSAVSPAVSQGAVSPSPTPSSSTDINSTLPRIKGLSINSLSGEQRAVKSDEVAVGIKNGATQRFNQGETGTVYVATFTWEFDPDTGAGLCDIKVDGIDIASNIKETSYAISFVGKKEYTVTIHPYKEVDRNGLKEKLYGTTVTYPYTPKD